MEGIFREYVHQFLYDDDSVPDSLKEVDHLAENFLAWADARCDGASPDFDHTFAFNWQGSLFHPRRLVVLTMLS